MTALRDVLTRMQSEATGCVAVLLVDLRDGKVIDSCGGTAIDSCGGDAITTAAVGRIMRDLGAPQHAILPGAGVPQEMIVLSDDCTYVCGRLADPPHHAVAAICRSTPNLGLIVSLLHSGLAPEAGA